MSDETSVFERFVQLAKRELQADDVRLLLPGEEPPSATNVLVTRLTDGRHIVASFGSPPKDRDALERRLAILANTFAEALASPASERTRARPPVATSLHEELKALAVRARAFDVVVIDGDSPVVWGSASAPARPRARSSLLLREMSDRELVSDPDDESGRLQDVSMPLESSPVAVGANDATADDKPSAELRVAAESGTDETADTDFAAHEERDGDEGPDPALTRLAIGSLRRLPELAGLHKGRHLRHVERDGTYYLALSFSGIYLLCLVFDGEFDELRAERAAHESLPRIERLVLALPPLNPDPEPQPMGGVIAFRRRRR